jgi:predicted DNA-binding transcriptional regulator AlpA
MADLEDLTGKSRDWISRVLKPHSFPTSLRTVAVSRLVTDHYEPAVAEYLTRALNELPPPAGNWLSVNRIAELLQRDKKWVETRIRDYEQLARYLLDDSNKVILHYPVEVFEILKQQSEENFLYPPAGDYITEKTIAERMNRSQKWVRNRRSHIEQFAEERRNDANRVYMYYPESVIEILEATESRQ